jgi:proline dehydrogenase
MKMLVRTLQCFRLSTGWKFSCYSTSITETAKKSIEFEDTETAYQDKSTRDLLRHMFVFSIFSNENIVNRSQKLVKFARDILGSKFFNKVMKMTVYGQFVAGENIQAILPVIDRYRRNGVRAILDYAVEEDTPNENVVLETRSNAASHLAHSSLTSSDYEHFPQLKPTITHADRTVRASARTYFYDTEKKCDDVMKNFLSCVNMAADTAVEGDAAFAAIKLTGLGRVEFLLKLSEVVEGTRHMFLDLADGNDVCTAQVTPQSFHSGLRAKSIMVSQSEADDLYRKIDTDHKGYVQTLHYI